MNRRNNLLLGLGFAALLARPVAAQDNANLAPAPADAPPQAGSPRGPATPDSASPAAGGAAEKGKHAEAEAAGKTSDVRVVFDEDSAQGEILCKGGEDKGDYIEYKNCAKDKLDRYDVIAIKKGIVASKEAYDKLTPDQQAAAKKVAFYDSAFDKVKAKIGEDSQNGGAKAFQLKQHKGALHKIAKEYARAVIKCKKAGGELKCPEAKPEGSDGEASGAPASPSGDNRKH